MDNIRKTEFSNVSKKEKRGVYHVIKKKYFNGYLIASNNYRYYSH